MFQSRVSATSVAGNVTDFEILDIAGQAYLVSTTRYSGGLTSWSITPDAIVATDWLGYERSDAAGSEAQLGVIEFDGTDYLVVGGGYGGALRLVSLSAQGDLSYNRTIGTYDFGADMVDVEVVQIPNGQTAIFGSLFAADGLARVRFNSTGIVDNFGVTQDYANTFAAPVTAMASVSVTGGTFIYTASSESSGVSVWALRWGGTPYCVGSIDGSNGLWLSAPTDMIAVEVGTSDYIVVAGAGSGSLSVLLVDDLSGMVSVADHILDDLDARFGGVDALASASFNGIQWIAAGGADDGVTLFVMLGDGRLVPVESWEDTVAIGLSDVSALAMDIADGTLAIFVGSASDSTVSTIRVDIGTGTYLEAGTNGGVLSGTTGNDVLQGGRSDDVLQGRAGADIISDGAGSDILTGGAGADVFVFDKDGEADRITDFQPGVDTIDLSDWGFLRNFSQLGYYTTDTGFVLTFGTEQLFVDTWSGTTFDPTSLDFGDYVAITRMPVTVEVAPEVVPVYLCRTTDAVIAKAVPAGMLTPADGFDL